MLPQLKTLHSRRFLLIYLAVVIMLLLILSEQYATDEGPSATQPPAKTFQPPISLPQLLLNTDLGVRSNVHLKRQWTYFVFSDPECQQYCDASLYVLHAVSAALGRTAPAIFVLSTDEAQCPEKVTGAVCAVFDDKQQRSLLKTADIAPANFDNRLYSNIILLINPQAKLQRRYHLPLNSSTLIEDFVAQRRAFADTSTSVQRR